MARRNDIIEALVTDLGQIAGVDPANVSRKYRFLDDVNDFPFITFVPRQELRQHRGEGRKFASLVIDVRAYVYDGDSADICEVAEDLADSIEAKIDAFAASHRELSVEEAEVVSLRTDDGLMLPYGIADLQLTITYDVEITT
jgi:hypothetical protein